MEKEKKVMAEVTEQELQVLELLRKLGYGQLVVCVREGRPVRVEEVRKSIQLR